MVVYYCLLRDPFNQLSRLNIVRVQGSHSTVLLQLQHAFGVVICPVTLLGGRMLDGGTRVLKKIEQPLKHRFHWAFVLVGQKEGIKPTYTHTKMSNRQNIKDTHLRSPLSI